MSIRKNGFTSFSESILPPPYVLRLRKRKVYGSFSGINSIFDIVISDSGEEMLVRRNGLDENLFNLDISDEEKTQIAGSSGMTLYMSADENSDSADINDMYIAYQDDFIGKFVDYVKAYQGKLK